MRIEREINIIQSELKRMNEELTQLGIDIRSTKAYAKTTEFLLKKAGKEMGKLNKNLSKAGDDCACKPIGNDNQCEETDQ
jgi:prefoldin subunit 5